MLVHSCLDEQAEHDLPASIPCAALRLQCVVLNQNFEDDS